MEQDPHQHRLPLSWWKILLKRSTPRLKKSFLILSFFGLFAQLGNYIFFQKRAKYLCIGHGKRELIVFLPRLASLKETCLVDEKYDYKGNYPLKLDTHQCEEKILWYKKYAGCERTF